MERKWVPLLVQNVPGRLESLSNGLGEKNKTLLTGFNPSQACFPSTSEVIIVFLFSSHLHSLGLPLSPRFYFIYLCILVDWTTKENWEVSFPLFHLWWILEELLMKKMTTTVKVVVISCFASRVSIFGVWIFFEFLLSIGFCSFNLIYRKQTVPVVPWHTWFVMFQTNQCDRLMSVGLWNCKAVWTHAYTRSEEVCKLRLAFLVSSSSGLCKTLWNIP